MTSRTFELHIRPCTTRPDQFRWTIVSDAGPVRVAPDSFASEYEAIADGMTVVRELERREGPVVSNV